MEFLELGLTSLIVFGLGAAVGSFLNVVIYRLPLGLSLLHPPSRCPTCLHPLQPHENVPVFGWLWLRGQCAHCRTPISARYPIVEAVTGLLFVLTFWIFGLSWQTLGYWVFLSWLLALAMIDLDTLTLPNPLTQSGLVVGLGFQALWGWSAAGQWQGAITGVMAGILAAVVGIWLMDSLAIVGSLAFGRTAMGGGDAKLLAMMGAWLGWKVMLLAGFLACAIGALVGGAAIALGWMDRQRPMPFGPFLAIAALIATFLGDSLLNWYHQVFFPTL